MASDVIDLRELDDAIRDLERMTGKLMDGRKPLGRFFSWWKLRRAQGWVQFKASTGGFFFGEKWEPMKPQYTRKDGTEVPAWGGVPRVNKGFGLKRRGGSVKGKKRPSGQRVKASSVMMQDTGNMRNSMLGTPLELTKNHIRVGPHGVSEEYAGEQDAMRPFAFWQIPQDREKIVQEVLAHIDECKREFANG